MDDDWGYPHFGKLPLTLAVPYLGDHSKITNTVGRIVDFSEKQKVSTTIGETTPIQSREMTTDSYK